MNLDEMKTRLAPLDAASLCDAGKATGVELRILDPAIRPLRTGLKMIGQAHTVTCRDDFLTVIKGLRDTQAGDVLVVDAGRELERQ